MKLLTLMGGLLVFLPGQAQTSSENHIMTLTARAPITSGLYGQRADEAKVQTDITYFDGLGRPMQQVQREASPNLRDIVTPIVYDSYGRPYRDALPFESAQSTGAFQDWQYNKLVDFYATPPPAVQANAYPYSQRDYEPSPLSRVVEQSAPGTDWRLTKHGGSHATQFAFGANAAGDVLLITLGREPETIRLHQSGYPANTLRKTTVTDEEGHQTREYTNASGQVVCKVAAVGTAVEATTYYVYDLYDRLTYVIPPQAVAEAAQDWDLLNDYGFRKKWLFQYRYDDRNRLIEKHVPGAAVVEMIYDRRDRLVLTRDGNRRAIDEQHDYITEAVNVSAHTGHSYVRVPGSKVVLKAGFSTAGSGTFKIAKEGTVAREWHFTKYDALNRPVLTGIVSLTGTRQQLQEAINADPDYDFADRYVGNTSSDIFGYDNTGYPQIASPDVLTVTYYDTYDYLTDLNWSATYHDDGGLPVLGSVKGLVTGSRTRMLVSSAMLREVVYYDDRLRPVLTVSDNFSRKPDRITTTYKNKVSALVSKVETLHRDETNYTTVIETYTYDHRDRPLVTTHQVGTNTNNRKRLSSQTYNAIGQLVEKDLHDEASTGGPVQSVDYRYNERGWLRQVNGLNNFDDATDKFGFKLQYADAPAGYENYSGNIGRMQWRSLGGTGVPQDKQAYSYTYDALNRLTDANYTGTTGNYNTSNLSYDRNGNILRLRRTSFDNLFYEYAGNQLTRVEDTGDNNAQFRDVASQTGINEYIYDFNGNMIKDLNKGIAGIDYNYLNLPERVELSSGTVIHYEYDARGEKHSKTVAGGSTDTTSYAGPFHYTNGTLQFMQHAEGRALKSGSHWTYEYNLTDHLGNVRVTVDEHGSVVQRDDYYPFGGSFNSWHVSPKNNYLYQGKEEQQELETYDFHARMYDPWIGRTFQIDPMSDKYFFFSPYSWVANNPLLIMDPTGMTLDFSHLDKSERKVFRKALRDLRKSGATGRSLVQFLRSEDAGRVILTAEEGSGGTAGSFSGNEWILNDSFDEGFGPVKEYTNEKMQRKYFSENENEKGGVLNIDLELVRFADADPMEVLVEEATHAGNYAVAVDEAGGNIDVNLASGDDEAAAKAVVGQVEHESGRSFMMFSNDRGIRNWGINAFSSKSVSGFGVAARSWKADQTSKGYKQMLVRGRVPSFFGRLIKK